MNRLKKLLLISILVIIILPMEGRAMIERRVLIIGLEGISPQLLISWMDEGKLPNLAKISKNGTIVNLTSPLPLVSPVTWASFSTGKNPGKHGIFGWQQCDFLTYKTYIPFSKDVKSKTFWEILSEEGKRVIIINAYLTYPPKDINGIIISGMPSPCLATYPPELKEEIEKEGYKVEAKGYIVTPKDEFIKDLYDTAEARTKTAIKLIESESWDLFFILFPEIDRLQHYLWKDVEENTRYKQEVFKYYKFIDEKVGELVEKANDATIFIVSDHGFGRSKKRFHVNQWLIKEGYLKLKPTLKNFVSSLMLEITSFLKKAGLSEFLLKFSTIFGKESSKTLEFEIDYESSKAFTCAFYDTSIYINPLLESKERMKIREEIVGKLKKLKDPETNQRIFKEVYRNSEIYEGPFLNISPDIILLPNENYSAVGGFTFSEIFESNYKETGTHKPGGILIVSDKNVRTQEVSILDIAPTILKLMGVQIPKDLDGKALI
jgi:predicted AlkP superfamily phosphohydrolase/phosphomutase